MVQSPFEILGIPKDVVQEMKSTGSLADLLKLAKKHFADYARYFHPDRNLATAGLYGRMANAMQELETPGGLSLAVRWYVGEVDLAERLRRREGDQAAATERESLAAVLGLLGNVSQLRVMGVTQPTSIMLQFGASRTILDVMAHDRTYLSLSATELADELPEQSERPEYVHGKWRELFVNPQGELVHYVHHPERMGKVDIVGFVPAAAFNHRTDEDISIHSEGAELGEGFSNVRMTPTWTSPETAWYLPRLMDKFTPGANVVVRHSHNGNLALAGTVQAQAHMQLSSSKKM